MRSSSFVILAIALFALSLIVPPGTNSISGAGQASRAANNPPSPIPSGTYEVEVLEDARPFLIDLKELFTDPEGDDLSFTVKDTYGDWRDRYDDGNLNVLIYYNGTMRVQIAQDFVDRTVLRINATDQAVPPGYAELNIAIIIDEVNDPPVIERIGSMNAVDMEIIMIETDQGRRTVIPVDASDKEDDPLSFEWDIASVLYGAMLGVNYDYDDRTGELWFITSDPDVPKMMLVLTVSDIWGDTDSITVRVDIDNVNDPPFISVPNRKATVEGDSLFIVPSGGDPDLDNGDIISYAYNLGLLGAVTPPGSIEFDTNTGRLVIHAISENMNGVWEVNISVVDLLQTVAWGVCQVIIENQNDPPVLKDIIDNIVPKELTVTVFTRDATDEDGDTLTYTWDMGDGSSVISGVNLKSVTYGYSRGGAYTVTLTATDGIDVSEPKVKVITVTEPDPVPDSDLDGMLDAWEIAHGLDPADPSDPLLDPDGDGLNNLAEFNLSQSLGSDLNPWNPDTDGDGHDDGAELSSGTDPTDPSDHPDPEYKDLDLAMYIMGSLLLIFALVLLIVFFVVRRRNRPQVMAAPVMDTTAYYQALQSYDPYQYLPPSAPQREALPPSTTVPTFTEGPPGLQSQYSEVTAPAPQAPVADDPSVPMEGPLSPPPDGAEGSILPPEEEVADDTNAGMSALPDGSPVDGAENSVQGQPPPLAPPPSLDPPEV